MTKGFKITIIGLSVVLAIVLAVAIFLFATREKPFGIPSEPSYFVVGEEKFLDVPAVSGANGYIFRIDNIEFESTESTFRVTNLFLEARVYVVEVCVKASKEKNNSPFTSPINITNKLILSSPVLTYDSTQKLLQWTSSGTDVSYQIWINGACEQDLLTSTSYDCSSLVGEFNVYVKAIPNDNTYLLPSVRSNIRTIVLTQQLNTPTNLEYNSSTGVFSFNAPSNLQNATVNYEIYYNGTKLLNIEPTVVNNKLTVDISLFCELTETPTISVKAIGSGYYLSSEIAELS